jgi:hypothetical protein
MNCVVVTSSCYQSVFLDLFGFSANLFIGNKYCHIILSIFIILFITINIFLRKSKKINLITINYTIYQRFPLRFLALAF